MRNFGRILTRGLAWSIVVFVVGVAPSARAAEDKTADRPIKVVQPRLLAGDDIPAVRTPLGIPNDYKPWIVQLANGRLLLSFTVRSNSSDGHPLGLRALISPDDGETWDFAHDRIVISDRNHGASGGGFGNTIQLADRTLVSCYSFRGDDDNTHVEAVRWTLPRTQPKP